MSDEAGANEIARTMQRINRAWLEKRIDDLAPYIHPDIMMVFPGFAGKIGGRDNFLAGFRDFTDQAVVHDFREDEHQVDVAGNTAVAVFRYEMVYERTGKRYHSTGRDLWVFERQGQKWLAVWRTMLDVDEKQL